MQLIRRLYSLFTSPKISNQPVVTAAKYKTHIIFAHTSSFDTDTDQTLNSSSPEEEEESSDDHHLQNLKKCKGGGGGGGGGSKRYNL